MKANQKTTLKDNKKGFANLIPMVLAVVIGFAVLYMGAYINGEIEQNLEDTYPAKVSRTPMQNNTIVGMNNISENWDSTIDIVQVVIIITVLAAAIGAIFLFTRFGR